MTEVGKFVLIFMAVSITIAYIVATLVMLLGSETWKGRLIGVLMIVFGISVEIFLCNKYI